METPPPYTPRANKSKSGLIIGLILGGVVLCCVAPIGVGIWGVGKGMKSLGPLAGCAVGFEQIRNSVLSYANDNGGKLPTAGKWMDQVRPYYKKAQQGGEKIPFKTIPVEGIWACEGENGSKTGIAYNADLSGKTLAEIKDKVATIVIFEVAEPGLNKAMPYVKQPKEKSPKLFGQPRDWFTAALEGDVELNDQKFEFGKSKVNVRVEKD